MQEAKQKHPTQLANIPRYVCASSFIIINTNYLSDTAQQYLHRQSQSMNYYANFSAVW